MSVIFGRCQTRGSELDPKTLLRMATVTARYGPDGTEVVAHGRIGMGFQAFHTHSRSALGRQPSTDHLGNLLVFDGRLDNDMELAGELGESPGVLPDSALILKLFERRGDDCFSLLIGDWALALWSVKDDSLYLARDHAGSRSLFYRTLRGAVTWSTYLESFFVDEKFPALDRVYLSRIMTLRAAGQLTPYEDIRSVSAAHYTVIKDDRVTSHPHWRCKTDSVIVYASDAEYDEHFLHLFRQAVVRRIGPGAPILAELSGGMDSTSIVCMADRSLQNGRAVGEMLDTISYFDDSEPEWNERPYFTAVEAFRHKPGIHFDCSPPAPSYEPLVLSNRFYPYPGADSTALERATRFDECIQSGRYRVILSGIGGDELLGGVPTPLPELADHLCAGRILKLLSCATEWCLVGRLPLFRLLQEVLTFTADQYRPGEPEETAIPPWVSPHLYEVCKSDHPTATPLRELLPRRPSAINIGHVWRGVLETLKHLSPMLVGCHEYRYPYLDRDLVEFLHRLPRRQLVSPGRRRRLMRRALTGIVPEEILERKRKAYVSRGPINRLRTTEQKIEMLFSSPLCVELGLIDREILIRTIRAEASGDSNKWITALMRTIGVEVWMQSLKASGLEIRLVGGSGITNRYWPGECRADAIHEVVARN